MNDKKEPEKIETLSLTNIAKGALPELFARELAAVIENIADVSTPWETKRSIHIDITFVTASEARDMAGTLVECKSKLASVKPEISTVLIDHARDGGQLIAVPQDVLQRQMFPPKEPEANVLPMKGNAEAK